MVLRDLELKAFGKKVKVVWSDTKEILYNKKKLYEVDLPEIVTREFLELNAPKSIPEGYEMGVLIIHRAAIWEEVCRKAYYIISKCRNNYQEN